jgi:hypothetical protein
VAVGGNMSADVARTYLRLKRQEGIGEAMEIPGYVYLLLLSMESDILMLHLRDTENECFLSIDLYI